MEEFTGKQPKRRMARKMGDTTCSPSDGVAATDSPPLPPSPRSRTACKSAKGEDSKEASALVIQRAIRSSLALRAAAKRRKCHASRINISAELLETEKSYVRQLKVLSSCYLVPLKSHADVLGKELSLQLATLLSTVEVIVAYHDDFLEQITDRIQDNWTYASKLGDVFMRMAAYLKSYTQYVSPYQTAVRLLAVRKDDEELQLLLESLKAPQCNGKGLKDLLIMPVQRIPRYNMILSDLKKNTWGDHRDYEDLCEAAARVLDIANHVETMSAEGERLEKKLEIASLVRFSKGEEITLAAAHRRYLFDHEVELRQTLGGVAKNKTLHLFAFSDLILFCIPSKSGKDYKAYTHISLAGCKHSTVPNPDDGDMCLVLHTNKGEMVIKDNRKDVVSSLSKLISENSSSLNHTKEAGDRTMVPVSPQKGIEAVRGESPTPKGRLRRSLSFKSMKGMVVQKNQSPSSPLASPGDRSSGSHSPLNASPSTVRRKTSQEGNPSASPKFDKLKKRLRSQSMASTPSISPDMKTPLIAIAEQKKGGHQSMKRSKGSPLGTRRNASSSSAAAKVKKAKSFQEHRSPARDEIPHVEELPAVVLDREDLEIEMVRVMKQIAENEMALRMSDGDKMDLLTSTAELKVKLGKLKISLLSSCSSSGDERQL